MLNRRKFLTLTGTAVFTSCTSKRVDQRKPNILLILVDDFGWKDLKYRDERINLPNMEKLMAEGVTFTDAYAASATCSPCRASILTGQHPARVGIVRHIPDSGQEFHTIDRDPVKMPSRNRLPLEVPTLAAYLKPLGYHAAFFGKWHLGSSEYFPVKHGFDEQHGVTEFGHPKSYYPPYFTKHRNPYPEETDKYLTDRLTDDVVNFIEQYDKPNPFLATLFYYGVHSPFEGRMDLVEKLMATGLKGDALHQAAMCEAVDESLGRIRKTLEQKGLTQDTVTFFLGDQGSAIPNAVLRGGKPGGQALYEGGSRIPFVIHRRDSIKPAVITEPVITDDVLPTLFHIAGGHTKDLKKTDGMNLMPLLNGQGKLDRNKIIMYRSYEDQYAAIRSGKWKLIAYRSGKAELFNLEEDLLEKYDLAKMHPEKVKELKSGILIFEKRMSIEQFSGCQ